MSNTKIVVSQKGIQYEKQGKLGQGQFGKVYRVADKSGNVFALKEIELGNLQLSESQKKALIVETNIMEKINHPRVLHLEDKIISPSGIGLVTTYCDGGDLESILVNKAKNVGLGEQMASAYLKEIGQAFYELRKNKIIHRDLKLANIFLKNGHVVVGDFGFAKLGVSITNSKLGTPYYMAPEILFSQKKMYYDSRCDLWSIGVCFYLLIFGVLPFDANSINELIGKIERNSGEKLPFPKSQPISAQTKQILIKLLQKHPEDRMKFSEFFLICGIDVSSLEAQTLNNTQMEQEGSDYAVEFTSSQIKNFPGKQTISEPVKSETPFLFGDNSLANVDIGQKLTHTDNSNEVEHELTPTNSYNKFQVKPKQSEANQKSLPSLKSFHYLTDDLINGFIITKNQEDDIFCLNYLNEINKMIFNLRVIHLLEDAYSSKHEHFCNGEINVTLILSEIFIVRKMEILVTELQNVLVGKSNIFKLNNFDAFSKSGVYQEMISILSILDKQTTHIFENIHDLFLINNPNFINDLKMYRTMQIGQVDSASKKLTVKMINIYQQDFKNYSRPEIEIFLRILLHICYFSKILSFPKFAKSPTEWSVFYSSLVNYSIEKIHSFVNTLQIK